VSLPSPSTQLDTPVRYGLILAKNAHMQSMLHGMVSFQPPHFTHFTDHHQVVSVTPAQYFSRKRGLANGIVYASGGLGGTAISFAMDGLISHLGPAWTFRIIGFMTLATGLPAAWLIKERAPIKSTAFIDPLVPS
jgi:nitrate/nitrite transporter NarK